MSSAQDRRSQVCSWYRSYGEDHDTIIHCTAFDRGACEKNVVHRQQEGARKIWRGSSLNPYCRIPQADMPCGTHCMNSHAQVGAARKFWGKLKHQAAAEDRARSRFDARAFLLEGLEGQSVASLPARAFGLNKTSRHFLRELNVFVLTVFCVILCKSEMQINSTRNTPHAIARDSEVLVLSLLSRLQQSLAGRTRSPHSCIHVDELSRHRGAKLRTQFALSGAISLLSLA